MANRIEEAIRVVLETSGREGVDALRAALAGVGDVSQETLADTNKLLDSFVDLNAQANKAAQFDSLAESLQKASTAFDEAQAHAYQLTLQLSATEKPSKELVRAQQEARKEVDRLGTAYEKQFTQLSKVEAELAAAGVDTRQLADLQARLRNEVGRTAAALERQAASVEKESQAVGLLKQRMADGDEAFRKFARSGQVSAKALEEYRARADAAAKGTNDLGGAANRAGGALGKLRSLAAPVLAFLSFQGARRGIENLAEVARKAEDARRSLGEMYKDVQLGNRVYAQLEVLAKRNGLALDATVAAAQKLKNFGLDPLAGSLQALIDQNAAVGGSQQDLEGKILALGQAWAKQKLQGEEILQLVERGVPVWDLLQKATGKNVQELQKLSEAGKLGRDVIAQLYETIGRENSGAAERSLGSLSGLIAQASARWLEFRQRIIDAGVGDYLKQQLQQIINSTGGLDALARRVSDGVISTLEALKRLGTTLAPVATLVRDVTLAIAEHARQVVFLAKVYAVLKLGQVAAQFSLLTRSQLANAAAATAAGNAAAGAAGKFGLLGTAVGKVPQLLRLGVAVFGVDYAIQSFQKLAESVEYYQQSMQAQERFDANRKLLQQEQLQMGQQLQQLYRDNASTAIKSAAELSQANRDQAETYKFALEQARMYYAGVIREARATGDAQAEATGHEHWRALGAAIEAAGKHIADLGAKAAQENRVRLLAIQAVEEFDKLIAKGETVRKAVDGLFKGIDWTNGEGLAKAADILSQMEVRGKAAAKAVREELATELKKLSAEDLPGVEAAAVKAFGAGSDAANAMADAVARARFDKLGIDLDAIRTGFTKAGREVTTAFADMVREIDDLGLTAEQKSQAIAQAFDNAFRQASTKAELQALKEALMDALRGGDLGFREFQQRIAETDAALDALKNTGGNIGTEIAKGASVAADALGDVSYAANVAAQDVAKSGQAIAATGDQSEAAAGQVQQAGVQLMKMSEAAIQSLMSLNKFAANRPVWLSLYRRAFEAIEEQYASVQKLNGELEAQAKAYDPIEKKLEKLREQYKFVDDETLRGIAQKQEAAQRDVDRRREEVKRLREEAEASQRAISQATEQAGDAATLAKPINDTLTIEFVPPSKSTATAASAVEAEYADRLSDLVAERVLHKIERARAVSVHRRNARGR